MNTSDKVGTIDECLYSMGNRVRIAKLLSEQGKTKLLETELEDIFYFCQCMFDAHCIEREG